MVYIVASRLTWCMGNPLTYLDDLLMSHGRQYECTLSAPGGVWKNREAGIYYVMPAGCASIKTPLVSLSSATFKVFFWQGNILAHFQPPSYTICGEERTDRTH